MTSNELMIGDWVVYDGDTEYINPVKIDAIDITGMCVTSDRDDVGFEGVQPIPLTAEILEKIGFTKSTPPPGIHARCYEINNKDKKYCLTIANYNKYKRLLLDIDSEDSECFNIKCDYVHQLQHALRLCEIDKDKEIEL